MKITMRVLISTLCLFIDTSAFAYEHGGGVSYGGYHNAGAHHNNVYNGGFHNGYHGYYHHNNVWNDGATIVNVNTGSDDYWYDDGLYDDQSTNVVIGVPEGGYYDPSCQTVQSCTYDGKCYTEQNCNETGY